MRVNEPRKVRLESFPGMDWMTMTEYEKVNATVADVKTSGGFGKVELVFEFKRLTYVNTLKAEKITQQGVA